MNTKKLIDYLLILVKHKWVIIISMAIVAAGTVTISLSLPIYWVSATSFTVENDSSTGISMPGITSTLGIASMLNTLTSYGQGQNFINLMNSRDFSEKAIERFDLLTYLKIDEPDTLKAMDKALKNISDIVSISISHETGIIGVRTETTDKSLSRDLCNYYRDEAVRRIKQQLEEQNLHEYEFLEELLKEYDENYQSLLVDVKEFQEKYNILDMDTSLEIVLKSYSDLVANNIQNEFEFEIVKEEYSPETHQYKMSKIKLDKTKDNIKKFESKNGINNGKYLIGLANIPELTQEYAKIYLNLQVSEKITLKLYPMLEAARCKSLKENNLISVLDIARLAGLKSKPHKASIVIKITVIFFIILCGIIILLNTMSSVDKAKWKLLWNSFWGKA